MRWLTRKDRGDLVGISPLVFNQGPSVRKKPQIILETKLGGWGWGRESREDGTSSHMITRQSSSVSCLMLVVLGEGGSSEGSRPCERWPEKRGGQNTAVLRAEQYR